MKHILMVLAISFISISLFGQYDYLYFQDYVYVNHIKSVKFHPTGNPLDPPVVYKGNPQGLLLRFDDMKADQKDYTYDIIHCNADWLPSELEKIEYIDGFVGEEIDNSTFSQNTFVDYTHYQLPLPNNDLRFTIDGNYLLVVYEGDVQDQLPVITRRFMVVDKKVNVVVTPRRPLDALKLDSHYEFDLKVNAKDFPIINPLNTVSVTVLQNYRWDNAIEGLKPRFIVGEDLIIDNTNLISFPGNKEFRSFDTRSLDFLGPNVNSIQLNHFGTDVILENDRIRGNFTYNTIPDANGQFVIDNRDLQGNPNLISDYATVFFTLISEPQDEDVYITGCFSDWQPYEMYRMEYDPNLEMYVKNIRLKQGYYDYYYAVDNGIYLDPTPLEGSRAQTENDYFIFVYIREPGDRYDRLIAFARHNSNP